MNEAAAQKAIRDALAALNRAVDAAEEAGYGSLVLSSLEEACASVSYGRRLPRDVWLSR